MDAVLELLLRSLEKEFSAELDEIIVLQNAQQQNVLLGN